MKANEFVKKFGVIEAKKIVKSKVVKLGLAREIADWKNIDLDELKRLVESWDLVGFLGGLHMAKADAINLDGWEKTSPYWVRIKQAIADVESCQ